MQQASLSSRFSAMNLDLLILTMISQACGMLIEEFAPELATLGNMLLVSSVLAIVYFVFPTKKYGQTPGKKLLSLKVIPLRNETESLTWGQTFLREFIGKILGTLPLYLGFIWARFNEKNRAWHDYLGRTEVISLIWEEEKTPLQKFQHMVLGILTIPLGVALVLGAFLYTSMPLDSIKEKIEAAGIEVGALSGSLAGGLHFSEIRRESADQSFLLGAVDVKFNLSALVYDRVFLIDKLTAEEGHIEVPPDFSWMTILVNLMAIGGGEIGDPNGGLGRFKMGKLQLKNISFENQKKVISQLRDFSLKNLELADRELRVHEAQFQIEGFTLKVDGFVSSGGHIEVASVIGGMGPEFLPLLKAPVDFHLKGRIGNSPKNTRVDGGMTIDKIRFSYADQKITVTADKLILNEMFKTALPLEELDLKLSSAGENTLQLMSSVAVDYGMKVCGQEFKAAGNAPGVVNRRADREFHFKMTPKPVENFSKTLFAKEATLDDLFAYELQGKKKFPPEFVTRSEIISDLCYQKAVEGLSKEDRERVVAFERAMVAPGPGAGLQALLSKAVPITVAAAAPSGEGVAGGTVAPDSEEPEAEGADTEESEPSPGPQVSPESVRKAMSEASALLRQGNYAEAKAKLAGVPVSAEVLVNPQELGAFYNLRAWIYLYSGEAKEAVGQFELAFNARKTLGDAEGLFRAHQELKNDQDARRWWEYLQTTVRENPESLKSLTPNLQKRLTSEASEESRP